MSGAVIKASEFSKLLTDCIHGRITSDDMVEAELFRLHGLGPLFALTIEAVEFSGELSD